VTTIETILQSPCAHLNDHLREKPVKKKKSKYNNNKKEVDGILFHSEREAKRYGELKLLLKAGKIGLLELQVPFELNKDGKFSYKYFADFVYIDAETGEKIVEDCKGCETKVFKKKEKLMIKIYGIKIKKT
jgi:hypothetical protein